MISSLSKDWLPYLRPSLTAIILILYLYIILITLDTYDSGPQIIFIDTTYGDSTYDVARYSNIHKLLNVYFLLILRFLYNKKYWFSKLMRSLRKRKWKFLAVKLCFFTIWVIMPINSFLIVICNPIGQSFLTQDQCSDHWNFSKCVWLCAFSKTWWKGIALEYCKATGFLIINA